MGIEQAERAKRAIYGDVARKQSYRLYFHTCAASDKPSAAPLISRAPIYSDPERATASAPARHAAAMAEQSSTKDEAKTPFTIITGFLGAGKTTLINYILTEQRDKRICVIENEFGEINIDEKLVSANMASKEDLIQIDNGCACCSIRGDLVRTLGGLVEKRQQFDAVMLETTGLADPAPIIATLKSNQWIDDNFAIDAVRSRRPVVL